MHFTKTAILIIAIAFGPTVHALPVVDPSLSTTSMDFAVPTATQDLAASPIPMATAVSDTPIIHRRSNPADMTAAGKGKTMKHASSSPKEVQAAQEPDEGEAADEDGADAAQEPDEGSPAEESGADAAQEGGETEPEGVPDEAEVAQGPEEIDAAGDGGEFEGASVAQYGKGGYGGGHHRRKRNRFLFTRFHNNRIRDRVLLRNRMMAGKRGGSNHNYGNVYYHKKTEYPYGALAAPLAAANSAPSTPACKGSCAYGAGASVAAVGPIGAPYAQPETEITYRNVHNKGGKNMRSGAAHNRVRRIRAVRDNFNKNNFIFWK
ncbi:hypothetical protein HDU76_004541 [Blyttiomyces sp. JEL0837]|nr:hypothetical protein HDU76_004541 [Blyttiomyces sp. JEL0837]